LATWELHFDKRHIISYHANIWILFHFIPFAYMLLPLWSVMFTFIGLYCFLFVLTFWLFSCNITGVYEEFAFCTRNDHHELQLFYNFHAITAVDTFFPIARIGSCHVYFVAVILVAYAFANCNTESIHLMISKTIVWLVLESRSRRWMLLSCVWSSFQATVGCSIFLCFFFFWDNLFNMLLEMELTYLMTV